MPIKVQSHLPAIKVLESENIFVMPEDVALKQDIRPLKILILNLMPTKITTETQLLRLLGNTPLQIDIELLQIQMRIMGKLLQCNALGDLIMVIDQQYDQSFLCRQIAVSDVFKQPVSSVEVIFLIPFSAHIINPLSACCITVLPFLLLLPYTHCNLFHCLP